MRHHGWPNGWGNKAKILAIPQLAAFSYIFLVRRQNITTPGGNLKKNFFFSFLVVPTACGSSWARDQTQAPAVTTPDPQPTEPPGNSYNCFLKKKFKLTEKMQIQQKNFFSQTICGKVSTLPQPFPDFQNLDTWKNTSWLFCRTSLTLCLQWSDVCLLSKFICWNPPLQGDGRMGRGLGHQARTLLIGISVLVTEPQRASLFLLPREDTEKEMAVCEPAGITAHPSAGICILNFSATATVRYWVFAVYKPPSLWYFITVAQMA